MARQYRNIDDGRVVTVDEPDDPPIAYRLSRARNIARFDADDAWERVPLDATEAYRSRPVDQLCRLVTSRALVGDIPKATLVELLVATHPSDAEPVVDEPSDDEDQVEGDAASEREWLEGRTVDDLQEYARAADVAGRSSMTKAKLVDAILNRSE